MTTTELIKMNELKPGDLFSFRTYNTPVYWRFVEYRGEELIYRGIRNSDYEYKSIIRDQNVLVKSDKQTEK